MRPYSRITEDQHQQALYRLAAVGQYLYDTMAGDEDSDRPEPLPLMAMESVRGAQRLIDKAIKDGQRTRRRTLGGDIRLVEEITVRSQTSASDTQNTPDAGGSR